MILRFNEVSKRFQDGSVALERVSLEIPRGQFCVILGPSGAGKSTLLRLVNGLVLPTEGVVEFDGICVRPHTMGRIRPRIGMVHQQFHLVPRLSVLKNVLTGTLPILSTLRALLGLFPMQAQRRACRLLAEVGLGEEHLYRRASQLSGGEQQRVAIARAFMLEPQLVLADEPVASLDPQTSRTVLKLLRSASAQHGATVLCSLHQTDLALEFAERVIGIQQGRVIFDAKPDELDASMLESIYLTRESEARQT